MAGVLTIGGKEWGSLDFIPDLRLGQCGEHLGERQVVAGCTDLGFGCLELMASVRGMRFILQERPMTGSLGQNEAGR